MTGEQDNRRTWRQEDKITIVQDDNKTGGQWRGTGQSEIELWLIPVPWLLVDWCGFAAESPENILYDRFMELCNYNTVCVLFWNAMVADPPSTTKQSSLMCNQPFTLS